MPCEAKVELGDPEIGSFVLVCDAPCPREVCPFPERVVEGSCGARD
jgi:hypothetical protein